MRKDIPIGEALKEDGFVTEPQIQIALAAQKEDRSKRLGTILIELGFVSEQQLLTCLGKRLNLHFVDLTLYNIDVDAVSKIPRQLAVKYNCIAVSEKSGRLTVAMSDPLNFYAQEDIKQVSGMSIDIILCESTKISSSIEYYYSEVGAKNAAQKANISAESIGVEEIDPDDADDDVPVIKLINSLLARGYSTNVSDIHIEPFEEFTTVRMRIDGVILDYVTLSKLLHQSIIARIKIMANMDIAEKRIPQDGHFRTKIESYDINVRVSVIPTVYGEKAVMRFLSTDTVIDQSGQFGMERDAYNLISGIIRSPNGIVYITGPTGSGKTTTLYMILEALAQNQVNISTIEDPVERNLPRINQMQVNNTAGLTFETGLRALLRQDPDIIMVGETRDAETAQISVRAAITGHLVLSTLHTNDAISSIVRLEDMGLAPYLIANSLIGVVAQRLVRKICSHCGYEYEPTPEERAVIGDQIPKVRRGKGCHLCNNTGYRGRIAIHEIVHIDKNLRKMITNHNEVDDMLDYALRYQGMVTLKASAWRLVAKGITTVEEMLKIAYYSN